MPAWRTRSTSLGSDTDDNDVIDTDGGNDTVNGGDGDDTIDVKDGYGGDTVDCGAGTDTVKFDTGDTLVNPTACENQNP